MVKKLLVTALFASVCLQALEAPESEHAETKSSKCKSYQNLNVCNTLNVGGGLNVAGNEVVSGTLNAHNAVFSGALSLGSSTIALTGGGDLLDYGFFYSDDVSADPSTITLLAANATSAAYTPTVGNAGITIAQAGTYLVWYSIIPEITYSSWVLNLAGTPLLPTTINAISGITNNGFAIITVPVAGQALTITNPSASTTSSSTVNGAPTVALGILRVS